MNPQKKNMLDLTKRRWKNLNKFLKSLANKTTINGKIEQPQHSHLKVHIFVLSCSAHASSTALRSFYHIFISHYWFLLHIANATSNLCQSLIPLSQVPEATVNRHHPARKSLAVDCKRARNSFTKVRGLTS